MLKLDSKLKIGQFNFGSLHSAKIVSSWDMFTDTAEIVLPKKVSWKGRNIVLGDNPVLQSGLDVDLSIGYESHTMKQFSGFVRHIHTDTPIKTECEDLAWKLKSGEITGSYKAVKLSKLLADILVVPFEVTADYEINQLRFTRVTPMQLLDKLKKKYGFKAWFRDGKLYAGLAVVPALQKTHSIIFNRNVITEDLEYRRAEDVRIKVKGIIIRPDNSKEDVELGDEGGEVRTFHFYDESVKDVTRNLEEQLQRLKYTGFRGRLTTFLAPNILHGDIAKIKNTESPEQDGNYIVKSVDASLSPAGGRQVLEIDTKI